MGEKPQPLEAARLAPPTRSLLSILAERLDLAVGATRLEVEYEDGEPVRLHLRLSWSPRWLCDFAEVSYQCPVAEPWGVRVTRRNLWWERFLDAA